MKSIRTKIPANNSNKYNTNFMDTDIDEINKIKQVKIAGVVPEIFTCCYCPLLIR